MQQAGIKNITLYEDNKLTFRHYNPDDYSYITQIETEGGVISVLNNQMPNYETQLFLSKGGNIVSDHTVNFFVFGLLTDNENLLRQIKGSIYGWCFLVEYYDGTFKFFNVPLKAQETKIKPHEEMSYEVELKTEAPSLKTFFNYTHDISTVPVYRADTTLITSDSTLITCDYAL
jgi:hypothetical protein